MRGHPYAWSSAVFSLLLCCVPTSAAARDCQPRDHQLAWYVPDYVKTQAGGYLGFLTLGSGYLLFDSRLELGAFYGWVPAGLGGADIHGLTLRAGVRAKGMCINEQLNWVAASGGLGVLFTFGEGFFLRVPERYHDREYYRSTASRWLFHLGTELELRPSSSYWGIEVHSCYAELTALDDYIGVWLRNRGNVRFSSMFSPSIGYRARF